MAKGKIWKVSLVNTTLLSPQNYNSMHVHTTCGMCTEAYERRAAIRMAAEDWRSPISSQLHNCMWPSSPVVANFREKHPWATGTQTFVCLLLSPLELPSLETMNTSSLCQHPCIQLSHSQHLFYDEQVGVLVTSEMLPVSENLLKAHFIRIKSKLFNHLEIHVKYFIFP